MLVYLKGKKKIALSRPLFNLSMASIHCEQSQTPSRGAESNNFSESSKYT